MKKILVFIDWYLPGYKAGGPIRSVANMVTHLSHKYQFLIVTRNTDYLESKPYPNIKSDEWVDLSENQKVYYFSKKNLTIKELKRLVKKTEFDFAYINGIYSFFFSILPLVLMSYFSKRKIIVAPRGMLSAQGLGVKSLRKKIFVFMSRMVGLYKKSTFHVTVDSERIDIEKLSLRQQSIYVVSNLPPKPSGIEIKKQIKKVGELRLVSIARISPEKNTLFALECLSSHSYEGNILFDLYGAIYNQNYWDECERIIEELPSNIIVRYRGGLDNSRLPH